MRPLFEPAVGPEGGSVPDGLSGYSLSRRRHRESTVETITERWRTGGRDARSANEYFSRRCSSSSQVKYDWVRCDCAAQRFVFITLATRFAVSVT